MEQSLYKIQKMYMSLCFDQRPGESKSKYRGNWSDRIYHINNDIINKLWRKNEKITKLKLYPAENVINWS